MEAAHTKRDRERESERERGRQRQRRGWVAMARERATHLSMAVMSDLISVSPSMTVCVQKMVLCMSSRISCMA